MGGFKANAAHALDPQPLAAKKNKIKRREQPLPFRGNPPRRAGELGMGDPVGEVVGSEVVDDGEGRSVGCRGVAGRRETKLGGSGSTVSSKKKKKRKKLRFSFYLFNSVQRD